MPKRAPRKQPDFLLSTFSTTTFACGVMSGVHGSRGAGGGGVGVQGVGPISSGIGERSCVIMVIGGK